MANFQSIDFSAILRNNTKDYDGEHFRLIKSAQPVFDLLVSLTEEIDLSQDLRMKLFSVIGYFIIPKDLYPEDEHGALGYIDDILISLFVIKQIEEKYDYEMLEHHWTGDKDVLKEILHKDFIEAQSEYIELYNELMNYFGF
jgi:uncharacterized membrane protein YkvA (DUF1232 family)